MLDESDLIEDEIPPSSPARMKQSRLLDEDVELDCFIRSQLPPSPGSQRRGSVLVAFAGLLAAAAAGAFLLCHPLALSLTGLADANALHASSASASLSPATLIAPPPAPAPADLSASAIAGASKHPKAGAHAKHPSAGPAKPKQHPKPRPQRQALVNAQAAL